MKQRMKGLGLALVAALAMIVPASAAQAEEFESASYPVTISGTQGSALEFTLAGTRRWKCAVVEVTSPSLSSETSALALTPFTSGCTMKIPNSEGELDVTLSTQKCTLGLLGPSGLQGNASIDCPSGQQVTVTVYNGLNVQHNEANRLCAYAVLPQTDLGSVQYTNVSGNITASANIGGIGVQRVAGTTTNCGGVNQSMTIVGNITLKGSGGGTAIWVG